MLPMKFIDAGYGNVINANRIISVASFDSAPMKRLAQEAKENGMAIDGWSCNISQTYWEADFIEVNGNLYVLFTLGEDYPVENSSEIQFYVWFV